MPQARTPHRGLHRHAAGTFLLCALLLLYVWMTVERSAQKLLWFDEFSTLNVATQPTLARMLRAIPPDANPPLTCMLARVSVDLFGVSAFALRLPSLCGAVLAILCAYLFIARRFGQAAALTGAALFLFSPACDFGAEARPYGLLLGLTALALVLWQHATLTERRAGTLAGLAVTVFALTITHPFGILWAIVPLFSAEAVRWRSTRQLDLPLLASILSGCTGFAIALYFAAKTHALFSSLGNNTHPVVSVPTIAGLHKAFLNSGSFAALGLLLPVAAATWWAQRRCRARCAVSTYPLKAPLHEWCAVLALICNAFLVYLLTATVTRYFWPRYVLPATLGCFLLLGMACGAAGRKPVMAAVLIAGFLLMLRHRHVLVGTIQAAPQTPSMSEVLLNHADRSEPIVVENAIQYAQVWWYSPPELQRRLHYLADAPQAIGTGDSMGDLTLIAMQQTGSTLFPTDSLNDFLAAHKHFFLWQGRIRNGSWLGGYLHAHHYELRTVARDDSGEALVRVSAPETRR